MIQWLQTVATILVATFLLILCGKYCCCYVLRFLIEFWTKGRISFLLCVPFFYGTTQMRLRVKESSSSTLSVCITLSQIKLQLVQQAKDNLPRTEGNWIPRVMLLVGSMECRVLSRSPDGLVLKPRKTTTFTYAQILKQLVLIALIHGISRVLVLSIATVQLSFSFLSPQSIHNNVKRTDRSSVTMPSTSMNLSSTQPTTSACAFFRTFWSLFTPLRLPAVRCSSEDQVGFKHLGVDQAVIFLNAKNLEVQGVSMDGMVLKYRVSTNAARVSWSVVPSALNNVSSVNRCSFLCTNVSRKLSGNSVSTSSFEQISPTDTSHSTAFFPSGLLAYCCCENLSGSQSNRSRVFRVRRVELKVVEELRSAQDSPKQQNVLFPCDANASLNVLASCLNVYGQWKMQWRKHLGATQNVDTSARDLSNSTESSATLSEVYKNQETNFDVIIHCKTARICLVERSHPSCAVITVADLVVKCSVMRNRTVVWSFDGEKTSVSTQPHGKFPLFWWASIENGSSPAELSKQKAMKKKDLYNTNGSKNFSEVDSWTIPIGTMPSWTAAIRIVPRNVFGKTTTAFYTRVNIPEAAVFWLPDGAMLWISLLHRVLSVYRATQQHDAMLVKDSQRRGSADSFSNKSSVGICIRCGERLGSLSCHAGYRSEVQSTAGAPEKENVQDTFPKSINLDPDICDVSKMVNVILPCLDHVENVSRNSVDVRIGRIWVFLDSTTTECSTEIVAGERIAVVQGEHVVLHSSTFSNSQAWWWSEGCLVYGLPCISSTPPLHFPEFAAEYLANFPRRSFEHSTSCHEASAEWQLCLTTGRIAVMRSAVSVCVAEGSRVTSEDGLAKRTVVSINVQSAEIRWSPVLLRAAWVIIGQYQVDSMSIKRWCFLTTHDCPVGSKSFPNADMFLTIGSTLFNVSQAVHIIASSFLLYRDGDSGTMDVGVNAMRLYMAETTGDPLSWRTDLRDSAATLFSSPPFLAIQHLRVWRGNESILARTRLEKIIKLGLFFADDSQNILSCCDEKLHLAHKSFKIKLRNVEILARPEFPLERLQLFFFERFFKRILPDITAPATVANFFAISERFARRRPDVKYASFRHYTFKLQNVHFSLVTKLPSSNKVYPRNIGVSADAKTVASEMAHGTSKLKPPNTSGSTQELNLSVFREPLELNASAHVGFFTHHTSSGNGKIYPLQAPECHDSAQKEKLLLLLSPESSWLNDIGQMGASAEGVRPGGVPDYSTTDINNTCVWGSVGRPVVYLSLSEVFLWRVTHGSQREFDNPQEKEMFSNSGLRTELPGVNIVSLLQCTSKYVLRVKDAALMCFFSLQLEDLIRMSNKPFLSCSCGRFAGELSDFNVSYGYNKIQAIQDVKWGLDIQQNEPLFVVLTGAVVPLLPRVSSLFLYYVKQWCRTKANVSPVTPQIKEPRGFHVSWKCSSLKGVQLCWRTGDVGYQKVGYCSLPMLYFVIPKAEVNGQLHWEAWFNRFIEEPASASQLGNEALSTKQVSLLRVNTRLPEGFFLTTPPFRNVTRQSCWHQEGLRYVPSYTRMMDVSRCMVTLRVTLNCRQSHCGNVPYKFEPFALETPAASLTYETNNCGTPLLRLPIFFCLNMELNGPDPLALPSYFDLSKKSRCSCSIHNSFNQQNALLYRLQRDSTEHKPPAFCYGNTAEPALFPPPLSSTNTDYLVRGYTCPACYTPLLLNIDPDIVFLLFQFLVLPLDDPSSSVLRKSVWETEQKSTFQNRYIETMPEEFSTSSDKSSDICTEQPLSKMSLGRLGGTLLEKCIFDFNTCVQVQHVYLHLGYFCVNAASITLKDVSHFEKKCGVGALDTSQAINDLPALDMPYWVTLLLDELRSKRVLDIRHASIAVDYICQNNTHVRTTRKPSMPQLGTPMLPGFWTPLQENLSSCVVPVLRVQHINVRNEDAAEFAVVMERCRILVNVLTTPVLYCALQAWNTLVRDITFYAASHSATLLSIKASSEKAIAGRETDVEKPSIQEDKVFPPPYYALIQRVAELLHKIRLSIVCNAWQTNVHWLDLSSLNFLPQGIDQDSAHFLNARYIFLQPNAADKLLKPQRSLDALDLTTCRAAAARHLSVTPNWTDDVFSVCLPFTHFETERAGYASVIQKYLWYQDCYNFFVNRLAMTNMLRTCLDGVSAQAFVQSRTGWCLATEAALLNVDSSSSDNFLSENLALPPSTHLPLNLEDCSVSTDEIRKGTLRNLIDHIMTPAQRSLAPCILLKPHSCLAKDMITKPCSESGESFAVKMSYVSFGSRLESLEWDTIRTPSGSVSWGSAIRPTDAFQFILSTPYIKLETVLDINLLGFAEGPENSPVYIPTSLASSFLLRASVDLQTEPIIGYTAELSLHGILWVEDAKDSQCFTKVPPSAAANNETSSVSDVLVETAIGDTRSKSFRCLASNLNGFTIQPQEDKHCVTRLPYERFPKMRCVKELLRTTRVSLSVKWTFPTCSEPVLAAIRIPVVILTCSSITTQQIGRAQTAITLNMNAIISAPLLRRYTQRVNVTTCARPYVNAKQINLDYSSKNASYFDTMGPTQATQLEPEGESTVLLTEGGRRMCRVTGFLSRFTKGHRSQRTEAPVVPQKNLGVDEEQLELNLTLNIPQHYPSALPSIYGYQKNESRWKGRMGSPRVAESEVFSKQSAGVQYEAHKKEAKASGTPLLSKGFRRHQRLIRCLETYFASELKGALKREQSRESEEKSKVNVLLLSRVDTGGDTQRCFSRASSAGEFDGSATGLKLDNTENELAVYSDPQNASRSSSLSSESINAATASGTDSPCRSAETCSHCTSESIFDLPELKEQDSFFSETRHDVGETIDDLRCYRESASFLKARVTYTIEQFSLALVKDDCIFCRCSAVQLNGSIEQDTSSQQKCVFDLDVKDISVEAIHPSRYSATAVATFTGRSATSDDSTAAVFQGLAPRESSAPILIPLVTGSESAYSMLAIRGQSRLLKMGLSGAVLNAFVSCGDGGDAESLSANEPELCHVHVYESFLLKAQPVVVNLTHKLMDNLYNFVFPPNLRSSKQAIALVNPRLPFPSDPVVPSTPAKGSATPMVANSLLSGLPRPAVVRDAQADGTRCDVKTKPVHRKAASLTFFKLFKIAPVVAVVTVSGGPLHLDNVNLRFKPFVQKNRLHSFKKMIDRYLWYLGRQATTTVISHKLRGWVSEKRQRFKLRTAKTGVLPFLLRRKAHQQQRATPSSSFATSRRRPTQQKGHPLGWLH